MNSIRGGLDPVLAPLGLIESTVAAVALIDEVLRLLGASASPITLARVGLISIHPRLFSVRQAR